MDVVTLALAKKGAKSYTDTVINNLPKGVIYRGSVNYYADLPSTAALGDCYTVAYKGTTGTEPYGAEYIWGLNTATSVREWIKIGEEIDLSEYATEDWVNEQISDFLPDAETYKTAELTEGQITDVIGVSDILIKGQTSQNGTPTPSSPVDINVVSESNIVYTSNKNLFNPSNIIANTNIDANGNLVDANNLNLYYISVISGEKYTMTRGQSRQWVYAFSKTTPNKGQQMSTRIVKTSTMETFTVPDGYNYIVVRQIETSGESINNLMILKGTYTTAPGYESHQGKELPLNLPVENLFKLEDASSLYWGVNYSISKSELLLDGITNGANVDIYKNTSNYITLKAGTYTISSYKLEGSYKYTGDIAINLRNVDNNTTYMAISKNTNYTQSQVITLTEDTNIYLQIYTNASGNILNNLKIGFQIEKGSKANAYTPYGTEPIELCKIGDYQDYFYKSGSKWYLHKEMTFEIRTSEDNWETDTIPTANPRKYIRNNNHTYIVPANNDTIVTAVCNYPLVSATNTSTGAVNGVAIHPNGSFYISADVYNNLNSSPIKIYIPLITPIDTEITDTTLISQLEAIYNAPLYEQTNITQTNNDLPMVLDITACKDNINGIKAFIRK